MADPMADQVPDWIERTTLLIGLPFSLPPSLGQGGAGGGSDPTAEAPPSTMNPLRYPEMNRFTEQDGLLLARTSPTQTLAMRLGPHHDLIAELTPRTPGATLIDLSDARTGLRLHGPGARHHLSHLIPLDLDAFPPGHCAQTLLAHLNVLVLHLAPGLYEIQCGRSFAHSLHQATKP